MTSAFDAPYILYLVMTGGISGIRSSLRILTLLAHMVSSTMAAVAVGAVSDFGKVLPAFEAGVGSIRQLNHEQLSEAQSR